VASAHLLAECTRFIVVAPKCGRGDRAVGPSVTIATIFSFLGILALAATMGLELLHR
jgi:hypothetical protein